MRWQELTRTTYYNTNKTESIDIVIPKVTNNDREVPHLVYGVLEEQIQVCYCTCCAKK